MAGTSNGSTKSTRAHPRIWAERKAKVSRGGNSSGAARILQRLQGFEELILHNELINYNSKRIADATPVREIPSLLRGFWGHFCAWRLYPGMTVRNLPVPFWLKTTFFSDIQSLAGVSGGCSHIMQEVLIIIWIFRSGLDDKKICELLIRSL